MRLRGQHQYHVWPCPATALASLADLTTPPQPNLGTTLRYSSALKKGVLQIQRQAHLYECDYYGPDPSNAKVG